VTEMDLLTRLRAEVPVQVTADAAQRFATAFDAYRGTGSSPFSTRRRAIRRFGWPSFPRLALMTGLAAAAVGAGIVVASTQHSHASHSTSAASAEGSTPAGRPATPGATETGPLTVQELAYRASAAALSAPAVSPSQWIYLKTVTEGIAGQPAGPQTHELWMTADSTRSAMTSDGHVKVFNEPAGDVTYAQLVRFSGNPRGLVAYIRSREASIHPGTASEVWFWTFDEMNQVFASYLLPPKTAATVFQAMPYIPGLTAEKTAKGVAFSLSIDLGMSDKLVLDPASYRVTSLHIHFTDVPSTNIDVTFLAQVPVSGPGTRR
jgi:hypothetical protein